jgi:hypothetical protein
MIPVPSNVPTPAVNNNAGQGSPAAAGTASYAAAAAGGTVGTYSYRASDHAGASNNSISTVAVLDLSLVQQPGSGALAAPAAAAAAAVAGYGEKGPGLADMPQVVPSTAAAAAAAGRYRGAKQSAACAQ